MATATFLSTDTTTQGTWLGVYGSLGYWMIDAPTGTITVESSPPAGLSLAASGAGQYDFVPGPTSDVRALQTPDGSTRSACVFYSPGAFTIALTAADSVSRIVRVYCVDFPNNGRSQTIALIDHATSGTLDTQSLSAFSGGVWLSWLISGSIDFVFTTVAVNAVTSGFMFDPAPSSSYFRRNLYGRAGSRGVN